MLTISTLSLSSCDDKAEFGTATEGYRLSIENFTQRKVTPSQLDRSSLAPPKRRDIRIEDQTASINFREFFSLSGCQLNRLVGEHNSLLNKHQDEVENLFYELEFQRLAAECLEKNRASEDKIYRRLEALRAQKAKNINAALFNALFSSREFQKFSSPYSDYMAAEKLLALSDLDQAITFFLNFSSQISSPDTNRTKDQSAQRASFDLALRQLEESRLLGETLILVAGYTLQLRELNKSLEATEVSLYSDCEDRLSALQAQFNRAYSKEVDAITTIAIKLGAFDEILERALPASREYRDKYWRKHWALPSATSTADNKNASTLNRFINTYQEHRHLLSAKRAQCSVQDNTS